MILEALADYEAAIREDERERIACEVEALKRIEGLWAPTFIAAVIRACGPTPPAAE